MADFAAATQVDGHLWIRQRLLANHNLRMVGCFTLPEAYLVECWRPLHHLHLLYWGLHHTDCDFERRAADYYGAWPDLSTPGEH